MASRRSPCHHTTLSINNTPPNTTPATHRAAAAAAAAAAPVDDRPAFSLRLVAQQPGHQAPPTDSDNARDHPVWAGPSNALPEAQKELDALCPSHLHPRIRRVNTSFTNQGSGRTLHAGSKSQMQGGTQLSADSTRARRMRNVDRNPWATMHAMRALRRDLARLLPPDAWERNKLEHSAQARLIVRLAYEQGHAHVQSDATAAQRTTWSG